MDAIWVEGRMLGERRWGEGAGESGERRVSGLGKVRRQAGNLVGGHTKESLTISIAITTTTTTRALATASPSHNRKSEREGGGRKTAPRRELSAWVKWRRQVHRN